ncbi:MAG: hypothetical protein IKU25_07475 [Clostridia bacterium]|nr:hypothetical protein [Clostridia bacterium]
MYNRSCFFISKPKIEIFDIQTSVIILSIIEPNKLFFAYDIKTKFSIDNFRLVYILIITAVFITVNTFTNTTLYWVLMYIADYC